MRCFFTQPIILLITNVCKFVCLDHADHNFMRFLDETVFVDFFLFFSVDHNFRPSIWMSATDSTRHFLNLYNKNLPYLL